MSRFLQLGNKLDYCPWIQGSSLSPEAIRLRVTNWILGSAGRNPFCRREETRTFAISVCSWEEPLFWFPTRQAYEKQRLGRKAIYFIDVLGAWRGATLHLDDFTAVDPTQESKFKFLPYQVSQEPRGVCCMVFGFLVVFE